MLLPSIEQEAAFVECLSTVTYTYHSAHKGYTQQSSVSTRL
jgi:hypothetical protein